MIVYHRTMRAQEILDGGFHDDDNAQEPRGVWLLESPHACPEQGSPGAAVLIVDMPITAIREYEQRDKSRHHRTFVVPACVVNDQARSVVAQSSKAGADFIARRRDVGPDQSTARVGESIRERAESPSTTETPEQPVTSESWPRWMTVKTCARYIDRTVRGVEALVFKGRIPFVKQGGLVYFDRVVLDKWMASWGKSSSSPARAAHRGPKHPKYAKGGA